MTKEEEFKVAVNRAIDNAPTKDVADLLRMLIGLPFDMPAAS